MTDRSQAPDVRNPLLAVPGVVEALAEIPSDSRLGLRKALLAMRADFQARAQKSWRTHKAPMALYYKCLAVYTGHIARLLRCPQTPT